LTVTDHFRQRCLERIGAVDAEAIGNGILWAIKNERRDLVQFVGRVSRSGKRVFRFRVADGRQFFALVHTENDTVLTVFPPGFSMPQQGKKRMLHMVEAQF
jgi:hypothetical protein